MRIRGGAVSALATLAVLGAGEVMTGRAPRSGSPPLTMYRIALLTHMSRVWDGCPSGKAAEIALEFKSAAACNSVSVRAV